MKALANLSIRNKLVGIVLVSTVLAVAAAFTLVVRKTITASREDLVTNTETMARMLRNEAGLYLKFEDAVSAQKSLDNVVDSLPWLSAACLFDAENNLFFDEENERYVCAPRGLTAVPEHIPEGLTDILSHPRFSDDVVDTFLRIEHMDPDPGSLEVVHVGTLYLRATTEVADRKVRQDILYMTAVMLAVVGVAVALAYLLQGFISKPILYLAEMAQRISSNADYSVRVTKPGRDEIGILYDGFNNMLEQIQKRQEDLERSNRDLDQFAYVASHDLKAPLRAISTLSGWIEEDLEGRLSEESSEQMKLLRSRVERMDQLIEGILQYSRAGRMDSRGEKVDVAEMLAEVVEILDPPDSVRVVVARNMPVMVAKRLRLEQVFSNLINNAIKYHDRGEGRVEVSARRQGRFYEFSVSDDGPGIAEEHHQKIFMMFQTLQPRDQVESTGLGLSLVKKLVEEEGGSIHLESQPGQGATFRFTWPAETGVESSEVTQS